MVDLDSTVNSSSQPHSSLILLLFLLRAGAFLCLFSILLELVTNQSIKESDHEVEDHSKDAPLPDSLDKGFFLCI